MSRMTAKAALTALVIGLGALQAPSPASAGSFTMMLTPDKDTARAITTGLQIYSIVQSQKDNKKKKNNAKVNQKGINNAAAVSQKGAGNYGLVVQRGKNHTATVAQDGWNNALGVFQFGKNTNLDVVQAGNGQAGLIFQGGW